jgi:hypothetical protein
MAGSREYLRRSGGPPGNPLVYPDPEPSVTRFVFSVLLILPGAAGTAGQPAPFEGGPPITVRLAEWKVELGAASVPAGTITFNITNAGTIPHAFEVEGGGVEKETPVMQPGATTSLTLALAPGQYEVYCPVGEDSHKKMGMLAHLDVTRGTRGYGTTAAEAPKELAETKPPRALSITGGGPVVQILPGPFPFADSAAPVIRTRPADQQADLTHKEQEGPYSNRVARIAGTMSIRAWDLGPTRDSVAGTAEFKTQDGASWRVVMVRVQTKDIPFNPRFGGVIMGLYYHGASGVHTPLVPTIQSAVALWAYARVYRNDSLVTDTAMVHVMLLSRTRREGDFALQCWDCSKNPVEELQLQVTPSPGQPPFDAPGGFLFVNWERSRAKPA